MNLQGSVFHDIGPWWLIQCLQASSSYRWSSCSSCMFWHHSSLLVSHCCLCSLLFFHCLYKFTVITAQATALWLQTGAGTGSAAMLVVKMCRSRPQQCGASVAGGSGGASLDKNQWFFIDGPQKICPVLCPLYLCVASMSTMRPGQQHNGQLSLQPWLGSSTNLVKEAPLRVSWPARVCLSTQPHTLRSFRHLMNCKKTLTWH